VRPPRAEIPPTAALLPGLRIKASAASRWDTAPVVDAPVSGQRHDRMVWEFMVVILAAAMASSLAFVLTQARRGAIAIGPLSDRSTYCRRYTSPDCRRT
jgi:hypothetical protein